MSLRRPSRGEWIASSAALALLAATFPEWYGLDRGNSALLGYLKLFDEGGNAWQVLDLAPILLAAASALTLGLVLLRAAGLRRDSRGSVGGVICVIGGLATLLVAAHIAFPPEAPDAGDYGTFTRTLGPGIYLSLLAAIGIAAGGWIARREEMASPGCASTARTSSGRVPDRAV